MRNLTAIIFIVILGICSTTHAQLNTTPGQPWTYVVEDSLPSYAIDTAFSNRLLFISSRFEVRNIFRLHYHLNETVVTDSNTIFIQIPREPGEYDLVEMDSPYLASETFQNGDFNTQIASFGSRSAAELAAAELELSRYIFAEPGADGVDTIFDGTITSGPAYYLLQDNLSSTEDDRYGYFIQFVDSVWHPTVSNLLELGPSGIFLNTYPNPTSERFTLDLPKDWVAEQVTLRLYDPLGKLILQERKSSSQLKELSLPQDGAKGVYTATVYKLGGNFAVAQVVKD